MILFNKYTNNQDHTWYDSTNVIYSKCYDNQTPTHTLKIVYKQGRTYLFKDVLTEDYLCFKNAQSNGSAALSYISQKYKGVRIMDTNMEDLASLRESFEKENDDLAQTPMSNLIYHIDYVDKTGEFNLMLNGKIIYSAVEGQVSIINLLRSMNIQFSMESVQELAKDTDEEKGEIEIQPNTSNTSI